MINKNNLLLKYYNLLKQYNLNDNGSIKASPDHDPNYNYHWIRDSNLIVSLLVDLYKYLYNNNLDIINKFEIQEFIEKFIDFEIKISNINLLSDLGEPKINLDGTPYNEPWGRPQNDGPALRIINYIKIINNFGYLEEKIKPLLLKNLDYLKKNWDQKSFDLWEEVYGYHYYTKVCQLEAFIMVKEKYNYNLNYYIDALKMFLTEFKQNNRIISSINTEHNREWLDTSIFMAPIHCGKNNNNLEEELNTGDLLIEKFNQIYEINQDHKFKWLGRYPEDVYYNGNPWFITTLAYNFYLYKNNKINKSEILENLKYVDKVLTETDNYAEQLDKKDYSGISAEYLGWNFAEFIRILIHL